MTVPYAGVDYRVEPLYSYELYGLVVSYRQHDGESSMHRWSNDHLNMADVCVVWSDTAFSPTLAQARSFWNGIFTCNVQTRDSVAWSQFKMNQLSNNHLISADRVHPRSRRRDSRRRSDPHQGLARALRRGRRRRCAARARRATTPATALARRFSSTSSRSSLPGFSRWRAAMYAALVLLVASLAVHFALPYRPYRD